MNFIKQWISLMLLMTLLSSMLFHPVWAHEGGHHNESHEEIEKGPHDGRLFKKGALALELLIVEQGMPPHFRAYLYQDGKQIPFDKSQLAIELIRFNKEKERVTFIPMDDFLQSEQSVEEPHSFDVSLQLTVAGTPYHWGYDNYEGRVKLSAAMLQATDIQTAKAEPQTIKTELNVVGKILANRDTMAPIYARYAGIIKAMNKNLGDEVTKGDLLATVESNESLQTYTVTAPISGTVVQKYVTNGELAQTNKPIYDIANLNTVWADFTLYRKEAPLVKKGMPIKVTGDEGNPKSLSAISYIAPLGIEDSQTTLARTVLTNDQRLWLPGMYVNGSILIKEKAAAVAVLRSALQRMNEHDVVFIQQGEFFEATPVTLGQRDEQWVEVLSGLAAGQSYVTNNSFYLKAEIGKAGASHEH